MGLALKGVVLRLGPGGEILEGMGIGGRGEVLPTVATSPP